MNDKKPKTELNEKVKESESTKKTESTKEPSNNKTPKNYDVILIPAKYNKKITIPENIIKRIPKKIILFSSVQFLEALPDIKNQLESNNIFVLMKKSKNYLYEGLTTDKGQLLGCNMEDFSKENFDAFLYIGDGVFHPKALLINNFKDVYCYNPKTEKLTVLDKKIHLEYEKKTKTAKILFLKAKNIGILITTKLGQGNPKRAKIFRDKILKKWPEKKVFMFFANEINFSELENFNFIDIYVNVACSRIGHDDVSRSEKPIINIADAETLL